MKKFLLFFVLSFSISFAAQAQYSSAVGLRLGNPNSISYKAFFTEAHAFEVYGGIGNNFTFINGAYQIHNPIEEVENLQWYYGVGGGIALGDGASAIVVNGYLGAQYTLPDVPLSFTVDWVPTIFLGSSFDRFGGGYAGAGIRYILNR